MVAGNQPSNIKPQTSEKLQTSKSKRRNARDLKFGD
jgi:hypothetical protein